MKESERERERKGENDVITSDVKVTCDFLYKSWNCEDKNLIFLVNYRFKNMLLTKPTPLTW